MKIKKKGQRKTILKSSDNVSCKKKADNFNKNDKKDIKIKGKGKRNKKTAVFELDNQHIFSKKKGLNKPRNKHNSPKKLKVQTKQTCHRTINLKHHPQQIHFKKNDIIDINESTYKYNKTNFKKAAKKCSRKSIAKLSNTKVTRKDNQLMSVSNDKSIAINRKVNAKEKYYKKVVIKLNKQHVAPEKNLVDINYNESVKLNCSVRKRKRCYEEENLKSNLKISNDNRINKVNRNEAKRKCYKNKISELNTSNQNVLSKENDSTEINDNKSNETVPKRKAKRKYCRKTVSKTENQHIPLKNEELINTSSNEINETNRKIKAKKKNVTKVVPELNEKYASSNEDIGNTNNKEIESYLWDGYKITNNQAIEKNNQLIQKYIHQMKNLEIITPDQIRDFITQNQESYTNLKNSGDSKSKFCSKSKKKIKNNDLKNIFKCNPFSSSQQLVMYSTLREIFRVPINQFKECRHFFTEIIPEICCQLFAEIFQIKISTAPKLIKKLFPNPVSPV